MSHSDPSFLIQAVSTVPLGSSTSAHLLAVHTRLLHEESKSLSVLQKKDHCGACGSIRNAQWSKVTKIKPKKSKPLSSGLASAGATVYKCLRCHQRTVLPQRNSRKPVSKPSSRAATVTSTRGSTPVGVGVDVKGSTQASTDPKAGDNQSSKKRAKARKQGGLQALLASKQRAQPSLDLLDFLQ
ncbi:unnamed protein product [Penicillium camemberti]|uniref:Str. FM013 n=1 Tax=Penicillium camemberti (strain FM 013) TaxID=1429867 RepID=A0A0G4PPX1_PENC3|nr:unnamed protein product [Penicillium camemberti]